MEKEIVKLTPNPTFQLKKKVRVAAYARVSTDKDQQKNSLAAQKDYFMKYIRERNDWIFVGMYVDEGISGTRTTHREGFKRMVNDALEGRIDYIVTKSISRFARNTLDTVNTVRKLKEKGVGVYFQKEDIHSLDGKGEFMLTLMAGFAQEEARSISENCTWGQRKSFADGRVRVPYKCFLGYDEGFRINKREARIVEAIYSMKVIGLTVREIIDKLEDSHIKSPRRKDTWTPLVIRHILTNEKYKGDALLQKSYTLDFMSKKQKRNEGELPQYYVENNHEAIISREVHEYVQKGIAERGRSKVVRVYSLGGKIICKECQSRFGTFVLHREWKGGSLAWRCANNWSKTNKCHMRHLYDEHVHRCLIGLCLERLEKDERLQSVLEELTGVRLVEVVEGTIIKADVSIDVGVIVKEILVNSDHSCEIEWIDGMKQFGKIFGTGRSRKTKTRKNFI